MAHAKRTQFHRRLASTVAAIAVLVSGCSNLRAPTTSTPTFGFGDPRPLDWADSQPAWNATGSALAFAHQEGGDPRPRLRVLRLDTGQSADVATGWQPAWSPAGDRIAFTLDNDLHVVDLATGADSVLVDDGRCFAPDWYPGGGSIVFTRRALRAGETGAAGGVWLLTLATGLQQPLVLDAVDGCWLKDGSGIVFETAYTGSQGTGWDLGRYTFADNATTRITFDRAFKVDPSISPDGTRLAWRLESSGSGAPLGVYVHSLASGTTALVDSLGESPAWSPDGSRIAYAHFARVGYGIAIWVMNADGTAKSQLTSRAGKLVPE